MKYVNTDEPDNTETPQPGDLIPYHFIGNNQPNLYNGIVVPVLDKKNPPALTAEAFEIPDIPPHLQTVDSGKIIEREIDDLLKKYGTSPTDFWDTLLKDVDPFSVRQYFTTQTQEKLDYKTLEMCETLNFGNRWYDQACSEMVLESLDFDPKAKWWCVEGGAAEIAKRMMEKVKHKEAVQFGKSVNAISYNQTDEQAWKVDVTVDGEQGPRPPYDAVFNSVPLGAMQHMHLEGLNLNWGQKSAIRSLGYGASCKVGIRFKTLWWKKEGFSDGGVGKTDLPIRCCVYPSYNLHDPAEEPGVLLASYTWSQEAERIGALIDQQSPSNEDRLKKLLFHDLARLHDKTKDHSDYERLYKLIEDNYLDHYAYNWYHNPRTVGAFAYFGPGQFANWYKDIVRSDGKHIVIGEAASAHHAWVVGALESAVRGVYQFLWKHSGKNDMAKAATEAYNNNNIPAPFGPIPAEYNRDEDIQVPRDANVKETARRGEWARMGVLFESIRLKQGGDTIDPTRIKDADIKPILDEIKPASSVAVGA
jgi:monoamine oxidase